MRVRVLPSDRSRIGRIRARSVGGGVAPAAIEWRMPGSVIDAFVDGLNISELGSAVEFAPAGLQSRHCCSAASGRSFAFGK
jgi:hypothetical protein